MLDLPDRQMPYVETEAGTYLHGRTDIYKHGDILDFTDPYPFDVIWCTGVLYHVKEQYRMIRKLYDLLMPLGTLVLESATIRDPWLRNRNAVQILWPVSEAMKKKWHLSLNVTHLPSRHAIRQWLDMVGFTHIAKSDCHLKTSRKLARDRVAYLATKP